MVNLNLHFILICLQSFLGNPFLPYVALTSAFHLTDGAARIFTMIPLFLMLEHMTTGIVSERDRVYMAGVPERIRALKTLVMYGFEPQLLAWQASDLSIALCPSGNLYSKLSNIQVSFSNNFSLWLTSSKNVL